VSRDFQPLVFFNQKTKNNSTWAPDSWVKTFMHMASNSQRYSTLNLPSLGAAVSTTPLVPKMILRYPLYFLCNFFSYWVVQFAYVFFIDIPFKGTVKWKLTWVKSSINQHLLISQTVPWYFYFLLKSLVPFNLKKHYSAA
jgi:hypothetical protein